MKKKTGKITENKEEKRRSKSKLLAFFLAMPKEKRYDFITAALRVVLLVGLIVIEILIIATTNKIWWVALILSCFLTAFFASVNFAKLTDGAKIAFYVLDFLIAVALTLINSKNYAATIFNIILASFYLENKILSNIIMVVCSFACYLGGLIGGVFLAPVIDTSLGAPADIGAILAATTVTDLIFFILIFMLVNMVGESLRKNKELSLAVKEIAEREEKLKEAYSGLRDVTVLKERNRIAKQIHDTTGHSITTIIMQTEAAKLLIDKAPQDAKNKIISANLQAVTALEELRKSVRVLSGTGQSFDLNGSLTAAINDTTEGTGIAIRSKIDDDINLSDDKAMFIYSSLKEGLNNGIRHGGSTAFLFELKKEEAGVRFLLSDNGKGTNDIKPSFGLKKMREEVESYGGTAVFSSQVDDGFETELFIPYDKTEVQ